VLKTRLWRRARGLCGGARIDHRPFIDDVVINWSFVLWYVAFRCRLSDHMTLLPGAGSEFQVNGKSVGNGSLTGRSGVRIDLAHCGVDHVSSRFGRNSLAACAPSSAHGSSSPSALSATTAKNGFGSATLPIELAHGHPWPPGEDCTIPLALPRDRLLRSKTNDRFHDRLRGM
jgi:hypothetical protein